jgi:hypothetical protein
MRNGQNNNNKRMRGRNNNSSHNNRRSQNPMTRVFESNGPDIKIRGTASHIAEKYVQLARDARSSGDPVAAENYYQHAEHYFRLIAAAQEQLRQNQPQQQQPRTDNDIGEEAGEDDNYSNFGAEPGFAPQPQQFTPREQPQPYPQPREQPQPRGEYREPRESRQPQAQADTGASGLPSFITGGGAQPVANFEPGASAAPQGERFAHRRRRPRGPRPEAPAHQDSGDVASE